MGDISRPIFRGKTGEFEDQITSAAETVRSELTILDERLAAADWLTGNNLSAADLVAFPVIMQLLRALENDDAANLNLSIHPLIEFFGHLARWVDQVRCLDGFANAYPPHWKQS